MPDKVTVFLSDGAYITLDACEVEGTMEVLSVKRDGKVIAEFVSGVVGFVVGKFESGNLHTAMLGVRNPAPSTEPFFIPQFSETPVVFETQISTTSDAQPQRFASAAAAKEAISKGK